jgi:hypothetical protein
LKSRKPEKNSYTIFMYRDFIPRKIVGKATPLQLVYSIDSLQVTLLKSNGPTTLTLIHNLMVSRKELRGHFCTLAPTMATLASDLCSIVYLNLSV